MDDYDKSNLEFILSIANDPALMKEWYESLSEEDAEYARSLIRNAALEVSNQQVERLDQLDYYTQDNLDCTEANKILAKFRLNV